MRAGIAATVFWFALLFVLPLPLWLNAQLGWLPLAKWWLLFWREGSWSGLAAVITWAVVLVLICRGYARLASRWPLKLPGAVMGLVIWLMLIVFSAASVFVVPGAPAIGFMELYADE